jgi:hypothetical protein
MIPFYDALYERFHSLHQKAEEAVNNLPDEAMDWIPHAEMNSLSVLIRHLTGAERFLIGDVIMGENSNRDRNAEFEARDLQKEDLIKHLSEADAYIHKIFERLTVEDLESQRTHPRDGKQVSVAWALLHALEHAGIHVGHIQMTVQLWNLPEA